MGTPNKAIFLINPETLKCENKAMPYLGHSVGVKGPRYCFEFLFDWPTVT